MPKRGSDSNQDQTRKVKALITCRLNDCQLKAFSVFFQHYLFGVNTTMFNLFLESFPLSMSSKGFREIYTFAFLNEFALQLKRPLPKLLVPRMNKFKKKKQRKIFTSSPQRFYLDIADGGVAGAYALVVGRDGYDHQQVVQILNAVFKSEFRDAKIMSESEEVANSTKLQRYKSLLPTLTYFFRYAPSSIIADLDSEAIIKLLEFVVVHRQTAVLEKGKLNGLLPLIARRVDIPLLEKRITRTFAGKTEIYDPYFLQWLLENTRISLPTRLVIVTNLLKLSLVNDTLPSELIDSITEYLAPKIPTDHTTGLNDLLGEITQKQLGFCSAS